MKYHYRLPTSTTKQKCKGDISPPDFSLMKITNPGGAELSYFRNSPFAFSRNAHLTFVSDHLLPSEALAHLEEFGEPNSSRYGKLIDQMLKAHLLETVATSDVEGHPHTVLSLFAVIKDTTEQLARPIENGKSLKSVGKALEPFHLAGATQIIQTLYETNTAGKVALHCDMANCYFQYPLTANNRRFHTVKCKTGVSTQYMQWTVLTMGWYKATMIAQCFTYDLVLRGHPLAPDTEGVPDALKLSNGAILFIVYDSVLIFDRQPSVGKWKKQILSNVAEANISLKYMTLQDHNEVFDYCGFQFCTTINGVLWRIAKATLDPWLEICRQKLHPTPRNLWRVLGFLTFAFTILERPFRLLREGRKAQAHLGLMEGEQWDSLQQACMKPLEVLQGIVLELPQHNILRHRKSRKRTTDTIFFTFDATPKMWCFTVFRDGAVRHEECGAFPKIMEIAAAEAFAYSKGMHNITPHIAPSTILVVGGDNIGVLRSICRGLSLNDEVDQIICSHYQVTCTVVVADIPTDENYSDIRTRPTEVFTEEEVSFRLTASCNRLQTALERHVATGKEWFGRSDEDDELRRIVDSTEE